MKSSQEEMAVLSRKTDLVCGRYADGRMSLEDFELASGYMFRVREAILSATRQIDALLERTKPW